MLRLFSLSLLIFISCASVPISPPIAQAAALSFAPLDSSRSHVQNRRVVYRTYTNARYKYSISYPVGLLEPQGEADNGDGQKFSSTDGKALLLVFGANNSGGSSVKTSFDEAVKGMGEDGRDITYKVLKKNWFVISGRHRDNIFYSKTIHRGDTLVTFVLEYPEAARATFDPITARIASSFSG